MNGLAKNKSKKALRALASLAATALISAGLVAVQALPASANQNATCSFASGNGTAANPFRVATVADLEMVRDCHGSAVGQHFRMTANIDLNSVANWTPIGSSAQSFRGHFDGGGKTISNLKINPSVNIQVGLFGNTFNAVIRNLAITNANVRQFADQFPEQGGLLVGRASQGLRATNITIADSTLTGIRYVGAVLGDSVSSDLVFRDISVSNVAIKSPAGNAFSVFRVGLFAGRLGPHFSISNSHVVNSSIDVSSSGFEVNQISGFIVGCGEEAFIRGSSSTGVVINAFSNSRVENVAGFAAGTEFIDHSCVFADIESEVEITIAGKRALRIGGFASGTEEGVFTGISSRAEINVEVEDNASRIGGALGEARDGGQQSSISKSEFDSTISVIVTGASSFADGIGLAYGGAWRFTMTDTLIRGQVSVQVPTGQSLMNVSNLVGEVWGSGVNLRDLENVLIDAQPLVTRVGTNTSYAPRGHLVGGPKDDEPGWEDDIWSVTSGVFWNGSKAPGFAPDDFGRPISASDFSSRAFLEGEGFNFNRNWCMINGQARVQAVFPGCASDTVAAPVVRYQGPTVSLVTPLVAAAGQSLVLIGDRLATIRSVRVGGFVAQAIFNTNGSLSLVIPANLGPGVYDLDISWSDGVVTLTNAVTVTQSITPTRFRTWTRDMFDGTVKMYVRDAVGRGKITFHHNGREIAWIRAVDSRDPKLNIGQDGLSRSVTLVKGRNLFEIKLNGVTLVRRIATGS